MVRLAWSQQSEYLSYCDSVLRGSWANHIERFIKIALLFTNTWSDCSYGTGQPQLSWQRGQPIISNKSEESDLWIFCRSAYTYFPDSLWQLSCREGPGLWDGARAGIPTQSFPQDTEYWVQRAYGYSSAAGEGFQRCPVPGTDIRAIMLTYPRSPHGAGAWSNLFISSYQP